MLGFWGKRVHTFEWDADNIEHIARHGVHPDEAEEVLVRRALVVREGDDRYLAFGPTDDGRYLLLVFVIKRHRTIRVLSAYDMTERDRRMYRRWKRG